MHAAETAEEIGMRRVVVPAHPGNLSAVGLVGSDLRLDAAKPMLGGLSDEVWPGILDGLNELEREAIAALHRMDPGESLAQVRRAIDLRYQGQAFELVVPVTADMDGVASLRQRFREEYVRQYGHAQDQATLEMTTMRVTVTRSIGQAPAAEPVTQRNAPTPSFRVTKRTPRITAA
jgi:N-methylhydantoinase A